MKHTCLLFFFFFSPVLFASAGHAGDVSEKIPPRSICGRVEDRLSGVPVEGARVVLRAEGDSLVLRRTVSDRQGYYAFEGLQAQGSYRLRVEAGGYDAAERRQVRPSADLQPPLALEPRYALLSDVTVSPRVSAVKTRLGRRTVQVGGDLQTSGNASKDLMNNLPSVSVDLKGNMTLRGSSNVRYYIDGRPTNVNSMELLNLLPASSIDRVEFVTAPSAREYSDGPSGIVNIITAKSKKPGFGFSADAGIGTGDKYNAGLNLNRRWKRVNLWGAYTFFQNKSPIAGQVSKTDLDAFSVPAAFPASEQTVGGYYMGRLHEVKAGVDFDATSRTRLAYSAAYRNAWRSSSMNIDSRSFTARTFPEPSSAYLSRAYSDSRMDFFTQGLRLDHAFDALNRIEADLNYEIDRTGADTQFAQDFERKASPYMPDRVADTSHYRNDYTFLSARADYTRQGDRYKLEAGMSLNRRTMDNPYRDRAISYMPRPIPAVITDDATHYKFSETVAALYATYSHTFFEVLTLSGGVRGEYWKSLVRSLDTEERQGGAGDKRFLSDSLNVFPSASLTWHLGARSSLLLSYCTRVARPDTRQLNPNAVSTNPARPSVGNPYLRPEYSRSLELSYRRKVGRTADLGLSMYYASRQDVIQPYLTPVHPVTGAQSRGVLYNTYKNYGSSYSLGTEFIASARVFSRVDLLGSLNAYYADYSRGENTYWNASGVNFTAKLSANADITDRLTVMALGRYNGKQTLIQGTVDANGTMDAGVRYTLLSGRMNLFVRLTDVFNTYCSTTRSVIDAGDGALQRETSRESYQSRVLYFTASYHF